MILEPKTLAARRSLVDLSEVSILFDLANDPSANVRFNALDTLTHLPLPKQGWVQVVTRIRQELQKASSFDDKAALLQLGTWVPHIFDAEDEVRKIEAGSKVQEELLAAVKSIRCYCPKREDYDREWAALQAPGFVLFTKSELLARKSQLQPEVAITASQLSGWWCSESPPDIAVDDPVLITLIFEWAAKEGYYGVGVTNNLLRYLEGIENFRPDLNGLFEEYLRCIMDRRSRYAVPPDRWYLWERDDENGDNWRSWQIAWTVSRGGIKGLISALATHLAAHNETRQLAALALIADSADYTLQRGAAVFGGGIHPPRLDPNQAPQDWLQDTTTGAEEAIRVALEQIGATEEVQFTAYHPKEVKPNHWYVVLAYVHLMNAKNMVHADSQTRLGHQFRDYREGHGKVTETIARGTEIRIIPELPGCRFNPPEASVLWLEDWHRIEFRMQASEELPGFKLNAASEGRISFYVGLILVADINLSVYLSLDVDLVNEERPGTASTANPYQAVFVSYSHLDTHIVEGLEKAYVALGMNYLRDAKILRSGEGWNPALLSKIEEADIFQLCWSEHAKKSQFVKQEWRHALNLQRPEFIRPVYWESPMPDPPVELADIHFAHYPL